VLVSKPPARRGRGGEASVEIETDKITVEIESPASGVLKDLLALEGEVVPVGRTIAVIMEEGAAGDAFAPVSGAPRAPAQAAPSARRMSAEAADAFAPGLAASRAATPVTAPVEDVRAGSAPTADAFAPVAAA